MSQPLRRRMRPHAVVLLFWLVVPAHAAAPPQDATSPAPGAGRGNVHGRVWLEHKTPAADVDVLIRELRVGVRTDELGQFHLDGLPPGEYVISARLFGRAEVFQSVRVSAGETASIEFRLGEAHAVKDETPVVVRAESLHVHADQVGPRYRTGQEKIETFRYDTPGEVLRKLPGVVSTGSELHLHGSRADEIKTVVSGIEAFDVLGSRSASVAVAAVQSAELVSGGVNPENGNALAGFFLVNTREGGAQFGGNLRWDTDRFGDPTKTFDRFDRLSVDAGGPTPVRHLTWFATYEGTFQDGYLRSDMTHPHRALFDFVQLGNRQQNLVNTQWKLAWSPSARHKVTLEGIANRSITTPYVHSWSRRGFVQVTYDTSAAAGAEPAPRYGTWSPHAIDSSSVPMNLADHVPTLDDRYRQWTLYWREIPSAAWVVETRLAALQFATTNRVGGKEPWEYDTQNPFYWSGNTTPGSEDNPYYATHGDYPVFSDALSQAWTLKSDVATSRWQHHRWKGGFTAQLHEVRNLSLTFPNNESNGLPGAVRSDYHNEYPQGGAYLHDLWSFEGLALSAGARFDVFTPGAQVPLADLPSGKRYKHQLSPQLGISYPISVRDALSFSYGWTYQTVASSALFENRGVSSTVATKGNPDLEPETDVSYQASLQHLFSKDVFGQFSLFFRDIYGLLTSRPERDAAGNQVSVWTNGDYASARGFELALTKSFSHHFSADAAYTYSLATGVASDPTQAQQFVNGGQLYLPISERPLRWDQRHTVSVQTALRYPGSWGLLAQWSYGSGLPFTPEFRNDRRRDPRLDNSRRLPSDSALELSGDRYLKLWGQDLTLFVDARNVLDSRNIASLSFSDGFNPNVNLSGGDDYTVYYSETGRAGGAYLQDTNGDHVLDWVPLHDPRVFAEGRSVRLGISARF